MGKNPADQFYFGDFQRDMHGVRLEAVGGWSLLLCKMWFAKERGVVSMLLEDYARFWSVTSEEAQNILDHLVDMDVGDCFRTVDGRITMQNRRMMRRAAELATDAQRKRADREEERREREERGEEVRPRGRPPKDNNSVQIPSGECPAPLHLHSSASSSASSSEIDQETDSYVRACVRDFSDVDPRLVEIAVLESVMRRKGSQNEGKPIRSPSRYFAEEIRSMELNARKLGRNAIDALLARRREQAE